VVGGAAASVGNFSSLGGAVAVAFTLLPLSTLALAALEFG